jgi:anti-sigma B factor antagonist
VSEQPGPQLTYATDIASSDGTSIAVVALDGELDLGVLEVLDEALAKRPGDATGVVVDLTELAFVDSAGIQALVAARDALEEAGQPNAFVVVPGSNVERILQMTGLLERLASHPDRDSALAVVAPAGE